MFFNHYKTCDILKGMSDLNVDWDEMVKKEARGIGDYDLGEVHSIEADHVVTQKGIIDKDKFYLPRNLLERYDGHNVWFKISKEEAQQFRRG
jgi:hypothetical protein